MSAARKATASAVPAFAALVGALALVIFAIFAGEYSTGDWLKLRRQLAQERDSVTVLAGQVDSLGRAAHDLETNPATQERVAREEFGMIRNGETLYRLVPKSEPARAP